jgi:hypothetical protein
MPFNGSGTFQPVAPPDYPAVAGTIIRADQFNTVVNDLMYNGLTLCLTRDGQSVPTANLPMANFRHTGVGAAVAQTDYARMDQVTTGGAALWAGAAGGTADALTLTLPIAPVALVTGLTVAFVASADNTGASTINLNGLGATAVETYYGNALSANHFLNGQMYSVRYDGSTWVDITPFNRATNQVVTGTWGFQGAVTFEAAVTFNDPITGSVEFDGGVRFDSNIGFFGQTPIAQTGAWTAGYIASARAVTATQFDTVPIPASLSVGGSPADATALAADLNTNVFPALNTILAAFEDAINQHAATGDELKTGVNGAVADLKAYGLFG